MKRTTDYVCRMDLFGRKRKAAREQAEFDTSTVPYEALDPGGLDPWVEINGPAQEAREAGDHERELAILLDGVALRVDTPGTYDRASIILVKGGELEKALAVLRAWPESLQASKPTTAAMTRRASKLTDQLILLNS